MTVSKYHTPRNRLALAAGSLALAFVSVAGPATAQQRDPAYAAAGAAGQVGEKVSGYLGYPTPPSAEVRRIAEDINIKRRALYAEKAMAQAATIDDYAFTSGCRLILQTAAGEKYEAPDGTWQTRGAGLPVRDPKCPK
jgi:uncharacterized protein YdbL (DUF1318 family)